MVFAAETELSRRKLSKGLSHFCRGARRRIHSQSFGTAPQIPLVLDPRILNSCSGERRAKLILWDSLLKLKGRRVAAKEIHAKSTFTAANAKANSNKDQQPGGDEGGFCHFHEVELRRANNMQHSNRFEPPTIEHPVENQPGNDQSGKQARRHAYRERDTKALDRTCSQKD